MISEEIIGQPIRLPLGSFRPFTFQESIRAVEGGAHFRHRKIPFQLFALLSELLLDACFPLRLKLGHAVVFQDFPALLVVFGTGR